MPENDTTTIQPEEFHARRQRVLDALASADAAAVYFAGDGPPPHVGAWRADPSFIYLTGIDRELGAAVMFDPSAEDPRRKIVLFLRPANPEMEHWDGYRPALNSAFRAERGFSTVMRTTALPRLLRDAARRTKRLACLHPFSVHTAAVSPDLEVYRKVAERVPGTQIVDQTGLIPSMRAVKSDAELALMRRAGSATRAGFDALVRALRPGVSERQLQRALEDAFVGAGAETVAYSSIVGSGRNSTVLHYIENNAVAKDGDMLVVDAGAQFGGYAADVTRTFPVSGGFSPRQRELYDVVLAAQKAAIDAVKPGVRMHEVDKAARDVIDAAGYADAFSHGIGHHLGLEVHDADPSLPLAPGMVVTIEPGLYLKDESIGIRIEDDILVTQHGAENLTKEIPKTADDVQAWIADSKR